MARYKIPYLVGNKLKRNHINWPTILRTEINDIRPAPPDPTQVDVIWPVDITFAQIMTMAWRVKEWTFSANLAVSLAHHINSPAADHTYTGTAVVTNGKVYPRKQGMTAALVKATEEKYLMKEYFAWGYKSVDTPFRTLGCAGIGFDETAAAVSTWSTLKDGVTPFSGSTTSNGLDPTALFFALFDVFPCLFNTSTEVFSPSFSSRMIGSFIPFQLAGNEFFVSAQPARTPIDRASATGTNSILSIGSMTVSPGAAVAPDFAVPMQYATRTGGIATLDTSAGSITGTMSLVAAKYWQYQNDDGDPVYDENTGEQINPLF